MPESRQEQLYRYALECARQVKVSLALLLRWKT